MRVAKWGVVTILGVTSFALIALPLYVYAVGQWGPLTDIRGWIFGAVCIAIGIGFFLGARYFFKMDANDEDDEPEPKPPSRFAPFLVAHRRELKVIAQAGLVVSLICVGAALIGVRWSNAWVNNLVTFTWITLFLAAGDMQHRTPESFDCQTCPERMRSIVKALSATVESALVVSSFVLVLSDVALRHWPSGLFSLAYQPFIFGWEILYFNYRKFAAAR